MSETFTVQTIARVHGGRTEPSDDFWGGSRAVIRVDADIFPADAVAGLEEFSHLEVVGVFHLIPADEEFFLGARSPRDNPAWPATGSLAHRNMKKINRIAVSRCKLLKVDGYDLHVEDLDLIDGTPLIEIKPWFAAMGPHGEVREPAWPGEMLEKYYSPGQGR